MEKMIGKLIVIDGVDGCGKSTQVGLLSSGLQLCGINNIITHEPQRYEPIGDLIYKYLNTKLPDPYTFALLYSADRNEHIITTIRPVLKQGITVITDRYHCTTVAYQGVYYNKEKLWSLGWDFLLPDIVIIIDGRPKIFMKRDNKNIDLFEENLEFQNEVRENYLEMVKNKKEYYMVNGENSRGFIHDNIMALCLKVFKCI